MPSRERKYASSSASDACSWKRPSALSKRMRASSFWAWGAGGAADPPGAGGAAADEAGAAAPAAGPACAKAGGTARAANNIAATMNIVAVSRARVADEATALHRRAVTKTGSRLFERPYETLTRPL